MKKFLFQLGGGFLVALMMSGLYLFLPGEFQSLDNKFRDFLFVIRGEIPTTGNVAIVDIDEKSLKEMGQWPWPRDRFAKVLENLGAAGAGIIGLDIVFAEPDNASPAKVIREMGLNIPDVKDNDEILARAVAGTPTVMGYVFAMENDGIEVGDASPMIPAIFIEKGKGEREFLLKPHRPILNIPILQDNTYSSGFFNTIPDGDSGIIRSVPLVMKYDMVVYPSLSMEMLRIAYESQKVYVNYDETVGAESVQMGDFFIPTDSFGRLFVNYRGPSKTFPYIPAVDIYNNDFDPAQVAGKFILIGTSAAGLLDLRATWRSTPT